MLDTKCPRSSIIRYYLTNHFLKLNGDHVCGSDHRRWVHIDYYTLKTRKTRVWAKWPICIRQLFMRRDKEKCMLICISITQRLDPNRADEAIFNCSNIAIISNRAISTMFTKGSITNGYLLICNWWIMLAISQLWVFHETFHQDLMAVDQSRLEWLYLQYSGEFVTIKKYQRCMLWAKGYLLHCLTLNQATIWKSLSSICWNIELTS